MTVQSMRGRIKGNARRAVSQSFIKSLCVTLILACVFMLFLIFVMVANALLETFAPNLPFALPSSVVGQWNYVFSPVVVAASLTVEWILLSALVLGVTKWFYRLCAGEACDVIDLFDYFSSAKHYFGSLWMELNLFVRKLIYSFLFLAVPVAICTLGVLLVSGSGPLSGPAGQGASVIGSMLLIAGAVLLVAAALFAWVFLKRYFLARYLYVEGGVTVRQAIKQSVYFTRGKRSELFLFDWSFFGWFLCCTVVIPAFYVIPYYLCASALYARVLIETHRRVQEAVPQETPTQDLGGSPAGEEGSEEPKAE